MSKTVAVPYKPRCKEQLWVQLSCACCTGSMPCAHSPTRSLLNPPQFVIWVPGPVRCPSAHPALIKCSSRGGHSASSTGTTRLRAAPFLPQVLTLPLLLPFLQLELCEALLAITDLLLVVPGVLQAQERCQPIAAAAGSVVLLRLPPASLRRAGQAAAVPRLVSRHRRAPELCSNPLRPRTSEGTC